MKFASSKGHTLRGADYGASGIKEESVLTREVGYKVDEKLQALGYEVVDCCIDEASSVGESLAYRINVANNSGADFFFEIHFNCGGGHGVEVFTYGGKEVPLARNILNNIVALGYTNRGIKDGSNLYVVRNTSMTGILIEIAFIDSQEDMNRYNAEDLANAIVKGLVGQTVISQIKKEEVRKVPKVPKYTETIPEGENIFRIPNTNFYIEEATDGRMIIHRDRGNYIAIGKGFCDIYVNNNNGLGDSKRLLSV